MPLACSSVRSILRARVGWAAVALPRMVAGLFRTVGSGERRDVMSSIANRIGKCHLETIIVLPRTECWLLLHSFARTARWRGAPALFRDGRGLLRGGRDRLTRLGAWQGTFAHGELEIRRRGGSSLRPGFCGGWIGYAPTREFRGERETSHYVSVTAWTIRAKPWADGRARATGAITRNTPDQEETGGNLLSPSHRRYRLVPPGTSRSQYSVQRRLSQYALRWPELQSAAIRTARSYRLSLENDPPSPRPRYTHYATKSSRSLSVSVKS